MGKSVWTPIRDTLESAASIGGNYLLPGSSLVTSNLTSKGSQKQLNSTVGRIANFAAGAAGSGLGQSVTGIPSASDVGAGWTNAGNAIGSQIGSANLGTNIASSVTNALGPELTNLLPMAGAAYGASNVLSPDNRESTQASNSSAAPFKPTRAGEQALPLSLSSLGGLNQDQQMSNIATSGVYGKGQGPEENSYFLNLVNRKLVDQNGGVAGTEGLSPISTSYLKQLGLGGFNNSTDLLQAISNWKA